MNWIHGRDAAPDMDLWTLLRDSLAESPHAVAVVDHANGITLSYGQLSQIVATIVDQFDQRGVRPGDIVVIAYDRSAIELAAVMACIARGIVYVGLDHELPRSQVAGLLRRLKPRAIAGPVSANPTGAEILTLQADVLPGSSLDTTPPIAGTQDSLCYISFTSGSSGEPKGVQVPRSAVTCLIDGASDYLLDTPSKNYLRIAPLAFDASTYEIFVSIVRRGTLHIFPPGPINIDALGSFIEANRIEQMFLTTGLFSALTRVAVDRLAGVRQVLTGGEVISTEIVERFVTTVPDACLTNCYGPTEATTFSTAFTLYPGDPIPTPLPIGPPIPGTSAVVLPSGELGIAGPRVATGYLNDEELTRLKFQDVDGRRTYLTGDLVDVLPTNDLVFRGRADRQVKIRGYRIEVDGVESIARSCPMISDVMIVPMTNPDSAPTVSALGCAYVLTSEAKTQANAEDEVRSWCKDHLPAYAVPRYWQCFGQLPINTNGKSDASAVREVLQGQVSNGDASPAALDTDSGHGDFHLVRLIVRNAWTTVLGHSEFEEEDDFFTAGGDSLLSIELLGILRSGFPEIELTVADLFLNASFNKMAKLLAQSLPAIQPHEAETFVSRSAPRRLL